MIVSMTEIEIKLQVPAAARAAVEREVAAGSASRRVRLQALYFDTPDRRLAAAGCALRLRKEGRRWVQTLKTGSAHGVARGEHNVVRALPAGQAPEPDLALHAGSPPGELLAALLEPGMALVALYRTDIWRRTRRARSRRGSVELAFDRGEIVAQGADGTLRRWPVCELEVELVGGSPLAVTEVAARWSARHGLWIDSRSKAERGDRLARGLGPGDRVPPVKAVPLRWRKAMTPATAWQALLENILAQALPNWSEFAAGGPAADAVHQLRVALRRLRSAGRFVEGWPGLPALPSGEAAAALFRRLGALRDRDVLALGPQAAIDAALAACGEPALPASPAAAAADWSDADRAAQGQVLLDLIAARLEPAAPADEAAAEPTPALRELAAQRLGDWHARLRKDARHFGALDDEARHRLRKRLKRLRYAVDFSAGLFPKESVKAYLARLGEAQDRLGEFNDLCVALAAYRPLAEQEPRAWFAVGWLAARRAEALAAADAALRRWRRAEPFWR